jgi:spore maturation protein CgeB
MRLALFCHSLLSDWNHGNAHFLRGVVEELAQRGADVRVYEPQNAWSAENLASAHGEAALFAAQRVYPHLAPIRYLLDALDLDRELADVDVALVHEWNDPALVARIGELRSRRSDLTILFHDTHHRSVTAPEQMRAYDLRHYDGVLAFGRVIRDLYVERGWAKRAWTWHEAADARVFKPHPELKPLHDLVWIGNWGDDERTAELHEFLLAPVKRLGLRARVHGVRYPEQARRALVEHGIEYGDYLPNFEAPGAFARAKVAVHVPRRPYVKALPGIPTIRPFEALACGVPLVCAPWNDAEALFEPGRDFLVARDGAEMEAHLKFLLSNEQARRELGARGRRKVLARHTCAHRVDELFRILAELGVATPAAANVESA